MDHDALGILVGFLRQKFGKGILICPQAVNNPAQLQLNDLFQRIRPDIMAALAASSVILGVVGAAKEMDVLVDRIRVIP